MGQHRFKNNVVVVSGGADGVGHAAALKFADEGAIVAILDIQTQKGNNTADEINNSGGKARFFEVDVSNEADVKESVSEITATFKEINILFNHAGTVIVKPFLDTTMTEWNRLMSINVNSMVHTCQAILPYMIKCGKGAIVNTCSVSGLSVSALESAYCVSKGACIQLTRAIAVEFRDSGIRCNGICPALIRTAHGEREAQELIALGQDWSDDDIKRMQGRICEPEEVADAVLYLSSDEAGFINGTMLLVDNAQMATT